MEPKKQNETDVTASVTVPDSYEEKTKKEAHPLEEFMWKGITCFLVVASCIIFGVIVFRIDTIMHGIARVLKVMEPILCGLVFAYLLNPIMNKIEGGLIELYAKKKTTVTPKAKTIIRAISITLALLLALVVIIFLLYLLIPELIVSISNMLKDLPAQIENFTQWVSTLSIDERTDQAIGEALVDLEVFLEKWIRSDLLKQMNIFIPKLTVGVFGVFNVIEDIFIGIIVSVYVLANKEKFMGQCKKILYAVCNEKVANTTMDLLRDSHRIFIGFVTGKIIDSFIIGVLCFAGVSILGIPYALIISVVIGVTNVIPFFGPYLGAISAFILVALSDFKAAFILIIFILVLQQMDGNLLGPKILGESTGLSAFWVIFAIIVGSGMFGFPGMIFGVPTFAVIYHIIRKLTNKRLKEKQLPTDTSLYHKLDHIEHKKVVLRQEIDVEKEEE